MNLTEYLSAMTADLSGIEVLDDDTEAILTDIKNVMDTVDISLMQQVVRSISLPPASPWIAMSHFTMSQCV